ncbi:MAG: Ribonuclease 3 [Verrucomicrobia subdivision 3 bacterium]|nr:Ribonuclease 3 [Limisphaerales bacterium]MCS1412940.1 Ribonuclease 3 [Limisphaerales bacterium]
MSSGSSKDQWDRLAGILEYRFQDQDLLKLALTHPSVVQEDEGFSQHNQRLEFLGDAVLQVIITHDLYENFPDAGEGPLTKARARLVNRRSLAVHARRLGLGEYLRISRGEEMSGGRDRQSALGDAFEALVGAIYLDSGFDAAYRLIRRLFQPELSEIELIPSFDNPKGELQEILQAQSSTPPQYQLEAVSGPDHDRQFVCAVYHNGRELGRGIGKSKKEAEGQAALTALTSLR